MLDLSMSNSWPPLDFLHLGISVVIHRAAGSIKRRVGSWINGFTKEIKAKVRLLNPFTVEQTMEVAARVEEWNRVSEVRRARTFSSG